MTSTINGRRVLRFSICSHRTTLDDIERVFGALNYLGDKLDHESIFDLNPAVNEHAMNGDPSRLGRPRRRVCRCGAPGANPARVPDLSGRPQGEMPSHNRLAV
jgi:hypothetical protein